jgi:hypothetical protein
VSGSKNITFRKFTALALLALMLVIHAVKAFHHHPVPVLRKHLSHGVLVPAVHQSGHHCFICDYQLAKDGGIIAAQFSFQAIQIDIEEHAYYAASFNPADAPDLNLRGPPAIA